MAAIESRYADLGRKLRAARKRKGISQENLALKVGITRRHLIRLELGQHLPSAGLRAAIAAETGVDAETFRMPEDDDEEADPVAMADYELFFQLLDRINARRHLEVKT